MSSYTEITKEFVITYYKVLSDAPDGPPHLVDTQNIDKPQLFQLYNSHAQITRKWPNSSNASYSFKMINDPKKDVCPDDLRNSDIQILAYNGNKVNDNILVNVYGAFTKKSDMTQGFWTQEFVLQKYKMRWYIIHDMFFSFLSPNVPLIAAECPITPMNMSQQPVYNPQPIAPQMQTPIFNPQVAQARPATPSGVFQPQYQTNREPPSIGRSYSSNYQSRGKQRFEMFDESKSITVSLTGKYQGPEIYSYYSKFGPITDKFYTHGAVYLLFADKKDKDNALKATPKFNGVSTKVDDGIIRKQKGHIH